MIVSGGLSFVFSSPQLILRWAEPGQFGHARRIVHWRAAANQNPRVSAAFKLEWGGHVIPPYRVFGKFDQWPLDAAFAVPTFALPIRDRDRRRVLSSMRVVSGRVERVSFLGAFPARARRLGVRNHLCIAKATNDPFYEHR